MDRATAVALVKQGLGFRKDLDDVIIAAMTKAITEFEGPNRTLPKFLVQEDDPIALVAGNASFTIPDGYLRTVDNEGPNYTSSENGRIFVTRQEFAQAESFFVNFDNGRPQAYAIRKTTLKFYPTPDINYTLAWSWYKSDPLPTANDGTNSWLTYWPYLVVARAGMFVAEDTQQNAGDNSAYARFLRSYADWNKLWVSYIAGQDDDNAPKALGSNY